MRNNNWKAEILTIPNFISFLRLILIPVYMSIYLKAENPRQFFLAGTILALSCVTDAIDGKIARRFHMISTVGKILDPVADKLTQFSLILCLSLRHPVLKLVMALFLIKEGFQIGMGIFHLHHGRMLPGALLAGKICTAVLFVSLLILVLFPDIHPSVLYAVTVTDLLFLSISLVSYFSAYFGKEIKVQDLDNQ